jgi:hypothetical protein
LDLSAEMLEVCQVRWVQAVIWIAEGYVLPSVNWKERKKEKKKALAFAKYSYFMAVF